MIVGGSGVSVTPSLEELRIYIGTVGTPITTGLSAETYAATFRGVIKGWKVTGYPQGSVVVDLLKKFETAPSALDSITGSEPPSLTNARYNSNMDITTWTDIHVSPGDVLGLNISSATTVENVVVSLQIMQA